MCTGWALCLYVHRHTIQCRIPVTVRCMFVLTDLNDRGVFTAIANVTRLKALALQATSAR